MHYKTYSESTEWFGLVYSICNGNLAKVRHVFREKLELVLYWLQLRGAKAELDGKVQDVLQKEAEAKQKLKQK
jgi:hypothetical protein